MNAIDPTPDHVLYIAAFPLPRSQRDVLRAVGVEVTHLDFNALETALRDDGSRGPTRERIASATHCVIGRGAGPRVTATALRLRQDAGATTWVTNAEGVEIARGIELSQDPPSPERHRLVVPADLLGALRELGVGIPTTEAVMVTTPTVRPPLPAPYIADPSAYTLLSVQGANYAAYERFREGRYGAGVLINPPESVAGVREVLGVLALERLICCTATEDLHLLAAPGVTRLWLEVAVNMYHGRRDLGDLMAHAMARDGGTMTLAALPEALFDLRDEVAAEWPSVVARRYERFALECVSPGSCEDETVGALDEVAQLWPIVPCEDPLAPDTDPAAFRPTLTTFLAARRYRSAPEVLREAYARWGARPYQEKVAQEQVQRFVVRSQPSSAEEVGDWVRLLGTLPHGRFRALITITIDSHWPRIEIPIANAILYRVQHQKVPCFTEDGILRMDLFGQVTNPHVHDDLVVRSGQPLNAHEEDNRDVVW